MGRFLEKANEKSRVVAASNRPVASVGLVNPLAGEQLSFEPSLGDGELAVVDVVDGSVDLRTKDEPDVPVHPETVRPSTKLAVESGPGASSDEHLVE